MPPLLLLCVNLFKMGKRWSIDVFLLQIWFPQGAAMLVHSLPTKSSKTVDLQCNIHLSITWADLVQSTTYAACQTWNGSACSHVFTTLKHQFLTSQATNWLNNVSLLKVPFKSFHNHKTSFDWRFWWKASTVQLDCRYVSVPRCTY